MGILKVFQEISGKWFTEDFIENFRILWINEALRSFSYSLSVINCYSNIEIIMNSLP